MGGESKEDMAVSWVRGNRGLNQGHKVGVKREGALQIERE